MPEKSKVRVNLYIDAEIVDMVDEVAKKKERSRNWIIRKLLKSITTSEDQIEIACS